jgi:predicted cupin superfamily sugar epimerase
MSKDIIEAAKLIEKLQLIKHPEGGYYREIYRSEGLIPALALTETHGGVRSFMTSIYFLLKSDQVSKFHRLKSDEIWYFHAGSPLSIHLIFSDGKYERRLLGPGIDKKQCFQQIIPAGCWFGATVENDGYSLVGCAVAPGFEFEDFELADRSSLLNAYPQHRLIIERLTP